MYHDKSSKPADLPIGARVFLSNHVKGKIYDTWNPEPYKIVGRPYPDKHVYVAESLKRDGSLLLAVNREHILHSRELVPAVETPKQLVCRPQQQKEDDGNDNDEEDLLVETHSYPDAVVPKPNTEAPVYLQEEDTPDSTIEINTDEGSATEEVDDDVTDETNEDNAINSDDEDTNQPQDNTDPVPDSCVTPEMNQQDSASTVPDSPVKSDADQSQENAEAVPAVRRNSRSTAGKHKNPHNLPESVIQQPNYSSIYEHIMQDFAKAHAMFAKLLLTGNKC